MAADPASAGLGIAFSITGGFVVLLGPVLGPWVTVMLAAFIGSLWTLGRMDTATRVQGFALLLRINLTALILTGCVAAPAASYYKLGLEYVLPLAAFGLGAIGDKFESLREALTARLRSLISGAGT